MKFLTAALAAGLMIIGTTVTLHADDAAPAAGAAKGGFAKKHPRRHQVGQRLKNQDQRIDKEVKEGEMSKGEAKKLHRKDRRIHREEKADAAAHGGHITKGEQKDLNRQENKVSQEIGK